MKKKIFTKEVKIGITFIVALFLLYFGINFLKGINIFSPANNYIIVFDNVSGMLVSDPVTINGLKIGQVKSMKYSPDASDKIFVLIQMDKDVKIKKGSKIELDEGLIGGSSLVLDVTEASTSSYYQSGDTITGQRKSGMFAAVTGMVPKIESIMPKIDSMLYNINALLTNEHLAKTLESTSQLTNELSKSAVQMNQIMATLNRDLPEMSTNMNKTMKNVEGITNQINAMDLQASMDKLDGTLKNIEDLSAKMNSKDNSMGLLFNDTSLYDSINVVLGNASSLLNDIKKSPSKYINVKVF